MESEAHLNNLFMFTSVSKVAREVLMLLGLWKPPSTDGNTIQILHSSKSTPHYKNTPLQVVNLSTTVQLSPAFKDLLKYNLFFFK